MSKTCRIITRDGTPCTREPELGALGFCWQHAPKKAPEEEKKKAPEEEKKSLGWEKKVAVAAVVLTGVEVLTKVIDLALGHLPEFFGAGDPEQARAKDALIGDAIIWPADLDDYEPGCRVNWVGLLAIRERAEVLREQPSLEGLEQIEQDFDRWFNDMNDYHGGQLLAAIEGWSERLAS